MLQSAATITCPKCNAPIELTEALAAPMLASARADLNSTLRRREEELTRQAAAQEEAARQAVQNAEQERQALHKEKTALQQQRSSEAERLRAEVARQTAEALQAQLTSEKKRIAEEERRRAEARYSDELAARDRDAQEKDERIAKLSARAGELGKEQADFRRREQEFADRERDFELRLQKEVSGQLEQVRAVAANQAEQRLSLQLSDKERANADLRKQIEDLQRKAQQGSQQAQGETLELVLEDQLRRKFPFDLIEPVAKGESGADVLQVVRDEGGRECGRILWESKRTRNWSAAWLGKLKSDQRSAKADMAVLISQAMPPDIQHFSEVEGVWVSSLACTVPVASALRASLLQLGSHRRASEGQQSKSELVYAYLTGPQFRARIEAIAERWNEMQDDLNAEKKATLKRWSKREMQLHQLLESTSGMYGDLQGIAGRDVVEIQALEEPLLLES